MGTCKLCGKTARLVKAHIIPESMYPFEDTPRQPLRMIPSDTDAPEGTSRKGEYDPELVCGGCESLFSPWDDYATRILRIVPSEQDFIQGHGENGAYKVGQFDYDKLKLFFVSLLWRASETTRPAFNQVNAGDKYTKQLAQMIKTADPGDPETFATFLIIHTSGGCS